MSVTLMLVNTSTVHQPRFVIEEMSIEATMMLPLAGIVTWIVDANFVPGPPSWTVRQSA